MNGMVRNGHNDTSGGYGAFIELWEAPTLFPFWKWTVDSGPRYDMKNTNRMPSFRLNKAHLRE